MTHSVEEGRKQTLIPAHDLMLRKFPSGSVSVLGCMLSGLAKHQPNTSEFHALCSFCQLTNTCSPQNSDFLLCEKHNTSSADYCVYLAKILPVAGAKPQCHRG